MRSKICDDGKARILAKVVVPMGVHEITTFALANPQFAGQDGQAAHSEAMNQFENLNKRQLFNVAKDSVALRGDSLDIALEVIDGMWSPKQIARARDHVERLFPEVD